MGDCKFRRIDSKKHKRAEQVYSQQIFICYQDGKVCNDEYKCRYNRHTPEEKINARQIWKR